MLISGAPIFFLIDVGGGYVFFCAWEWPRKDVTDGTYCTRKKKFSPGGFLDILHIRSSYSHDPRVGTDTIGPGEAVFTIRRAKFEGVTIIRLKFRKSESIKILKLHFLFLFCPFFEGGIFSRAYRSISFCALNRISNRCVCMACFKYTRIGPFAHTT